MNLTELKDILQKAGVVGAGGAGFPSYAKLNENADTLILNCAECEPLLKLHRQVMQVYAREILTALETVRAAVDAKQVIIAIKPSYKKAVDAVKAQLEDFPLTKIGFLPEVYPAGDEVVTIYETTGRVVPAGKLPISVGVTVFNVETMLNVYNAITDGKGVTHKFITVTGEVKNPITLRVPLGITVGEVLKLAGGTTIEDYTLINGGPMTGNIVSEASVITKTSNAILVMPNDQYIVKKRLSDAKISLKRAMSACCQCRMCTELCPRNLLGHPIEPSKFMRSVSSGTATDTKAYLGTFFCSACGLCEMYSCFQGLSPRSLIGIMKGELRKGGIAIPEVKDAPVKSEREGRYILKSRLTARLGLTKYNFPALLDEKEYKPKTVKLLLSQHIGAPATAVCKVGDTVKTGDVIATAAQGALSVAINASIDGKVKEVNSKYVIIAAK
ncbi:MAG: SLBB domain-containing protein [Clostridia bacterium]|nr:SLBB domain-containing protein [Clostridia bacterium]